MGICFEDLLEEAVLEKISLQNLAPPTQNGHDAGILATIIPAGMLFVRNPTGNSHSAAETATIEDCVVGVEALADVLEDLMVAPFAVEA